jgi:hypothetical protein
MNQKILYLKDREKTEKEITSEIRGYLNFKGIFHWKVWQGPMSKGGISDILGILPQGKLLAIEVKTRKGKASPNQQAFIEIIKNRGGVAFIARSVDDVRGELENYIRR